MVSTFSLVDFFHEFEEQLVRETFGQLVDMGID